MRRNPMYLGAALALGGAALFDRSPGLLAYMLGCLLVAHFFVVGYAEPALRAAFGEGYAEYGRRVRRWWPWSR
ncbi:MAG TPA: hypothetical protein VHR43_07700 [Gemmatimonadales bacterium]|nr:hypothetical protein [Gemmatimonadales bacterium]